MSARESLGLAAGVRQRPLAARRCLDQQALAMPHLQAERDSGGTPATVDGNARGITQGHAAMRRVDEAVNASSLNAGVTPWSASVKGGQQLLTGLCVGGDEHRRRRRRGGRWNQRTSLVLGGGISASRPTVAITPSAFASTSFA